MASTYMTPGVYIEEKNAFPGSAVAVETAVPVFIGYTETAERKGKSLVGEPTRVTSFAEYVQWFGHGYNHKFKLKAAGTGATKDKDKTKTLDELKAAIDARVKTAKEVTGITADEIKKLDEDATKEKAKLDEDAKLKEKPKVDENANVIKAFKTEDLDNPDQMFYFYNCIRLFYQNGGSNCYIMSLGTYGEGENKKTEVKVDDFPDTVFEKLAKTFEPTMVVIPDFVTNRDDCYNLYVKILRHCEKTQSRFGIFDVIPAAADNSDDKATIKYFRDKIGSESLKYGAAYYPWLNTAIVTASEIDFNNLDQDRDSLLPLFLSASNVKNMQEALQKDDDAIAAATDEEKKKEIKQSSDKQLHQALWASSVIYQQVMTEIRNKLNLLPPSAAMAGIYSLVDSTRGVWKSPANVSLSMVNSPAVNISSEEQQNMNIDAVTGKSVNAIRPFPGLGSLVWGARTLDGNSQDWRYINVRRTMIMIEQSLKLACRAYVFEPNDSGTWVTMKSMMNNFLNNLWKQGALSGAVPEQAFDVQVGLGATMTATDILDGYLLVTVKLALVRPAEFIVLTFQQQQQQS